MDQNPAPIFYVDDDQDDLNFFLSACEVTGKDVRLFSRVDKLMDKLLDPESKPSVVFIDLNMPFISGYDVIEKIKEVESLRKIPLVVLSTATDKYSVKKSRELGADYYIVKPSSFPLLTDAIKYVSDINWETHDPNITFLYKHSEVLN